MIAGIWLVQDGKAFWTSKKKKKRKKEINKEKHYLLAIPVNEVVKLVSRTWSATNSLSYHVSKHN